MKKLDAKAIRSIKIIAVIVCLSIVVSLVLTVLFNNVFSNSEENAGIAFKDLADNYPIIGRIAFVLATMVQVIIAFIPGEILEQAAGYFYGPFEGTLLSLIGNVAGSVLVLLIVRRFGRRLVYAIYPKEKIEQISFLQRGKKRNILTAILFTVPGTPKDLLTYVIGLTDMSIPLYLLLTTFSRTPSIIMSTISGSWIADVIQGEEVISKLIAWNAVAFTLCLIGYIVFLIIKNRHGKNK